MTWETGMPRGRSDIAAFRSFLYLLGKLLGDVRATQTGRIGRRVGRRLAGKATGRFLGKLFK